MAEPEQPASHLRQVSSTAVAKFLAMGVAGVAGVVTSRLIVQHYGVDAFAQYGLLTGLSSLLPFADLGIAAVLINVVAESRDPGDDPQVRRTIVAAVRTLCMSAAVVVAVTLAIHVLGLWPAILGEGLTPRGGPLAATLSMVVFGVALPLGVGQRLLVGSGRTALQTGLSGLGSPLVLLALAASVAASAPVGSYVAVFSYAANAVVALICLVVAARVLSPGVRAALRDVPRLRTVRGASVVGVAGPMLIQMIALPIAMQTDRLLLSHLAQVTELARYNFSAQMFGLISQTLAAAGIALWPIYAKARTDGRVESPARAVWMFGSIGLGLALVLWAALPLATTIVTDGKIHVPWTLAAAFVLFVTVQAAKYPFGMYMTDARGLRFQVLPILILVPINLGLSWVLIGPLGAAGPVLGSAISVLACQIVPDWWFVRRDVAARRALASGVAASGR